MVWVFFFFIRTKAPQMGLFYCHTKDMFREDHAMEG